MHSQGAHIVTRCQWNTAFDSKSLAHQLQTDISSWSAYKMKRIMNSVFDSICPKGQTLKIKKLAVDLGAITYENLLSELPLRLEEALRNALYELILYPKNGDTTLEIIHEDVAQINVLRDFLLQGILPWNYQETYGTAIQIMHLQLGSNRLDVIQMIQEIGVFENVRKRIAWQFPETVIKKIITGLEPNNHQQIFHFSEEFVKVQEKETIVKTSTNDLKKNIWLWILNYLFTERGTIFNRIAFVKSTVLQMANHFNISYDAMIELIEDAIVRASEYSQVDNSFIAILKLLTDEVTNTAFSRIKTEKQQENYWAKVVTYFNEASARSTNAQKNEFNELVINLSKLNATRFQKIMLNVEQKPTVWKAIVKDLIPAAVENLFLALSPVQSKNVLKQISFLAKLPTTKQVHVDILDLYTFGIEFCVTHQNTSVAKTAFLDFITQKLAQQQQQTKLVTLDYFVTANVSNTQKKTHFISLFNELNALYQKEIANTKSYTSEATLHQILVRYATEITQTSNTTATVITLEKTLQKWLTASPTRFWTVVHMLEKSAKLNVHIETLVASYGTKRFLKATQHEAYTVLTKIQEILERLISKNPKQASALRAIKNELFSIGFHVVWKHPKASTADFFANVLQQITQGNNLQIAAKDIQEALQLLLQTSKIRTLSWSAREFVTIQKNYKIQAAQTPLQTALLLTQETNQHSEVAKQLSTLVRAKKMHTREFKENEQHFISYLISNGVQLQKNIIDQFTTQLSTTQTAHSVSALKQLLQELFWHVLVAYESHRRDARRFVQLFEKTVFQTFSELAKPIQKSLEASVKVDTVSKEITDFQIDSKITTETLLEAIRFSLQKTSTQHTIGQKTYNFSTLFTIGLRTAPATIREILKENTITETRLNFLAKHVSFEVFITAQLKNTSNTISEAFKAIHTVFSIVQEYGTSQIINILGMIFWRQTVALLQSTHTTEKILKILISNTLKQLSTVSTKTQLVIIETLQRKNITVSKLLKTMVQTFPILNSNVEKSAKENAPSKSPVTKIEHLQTPYRISITEVFEAIQSNLQSRTAQFEIGKKTYHFSELFALGLETSPTNIRAIFEETPLTEAQLNFLTQHSNLETFMAFQANDTSSAHSEAFNAIQVLFRIAKQLGNTQTIMALQTVFWKHLIALIQGKQTAKKIVKKLVKITFDKLSEIATLDQITIVKHIQNTNITVPKLLKKVLVKRHRIFELVYEEQHKTSLSKAIQKYSQTDKIELLSQHLIVQQEIPTWFVHNEAYSYERILNELIAQQPLVILKTLRSQHISEVQLLQFVQTIHFDTFIRALRVLYSGQQKELLDIQKLYENSAFVDLRGLSTKSLQEIIIRKVVMAWQTSNWSLIASTNIWNELLWEICGKKGISQRNFFAAMNTIKTMLPTALLVTYKSVVASEKAVQQLPTETTINTLDNNHMNSSTTTFPEEGVAIPNAGLVMLNSYFIMLLERLGATKSNAFVSDEMQLNAVHYLQYIVTGMTKTDESLLALNKLLAGLSPTTPVKDAVEMTEDQKNLIDGMIKAAIGYWPEIGQTSINGFRGNWLVREGVLRETEERWELTVEKRPYDVLMIKSPFSFSIIKLPWMHKPLHVTWPF
ncbi:MAG: contractile injection system tape measure protein [Bacteroidota bacterium]